MASAQKRNANRKGPHQGRVTQSKKQMASVSGNGGNSAGDGLDGEASSAKLPAGAPTLNRAMRRSSQGQVAMQQIAAQQTLMATQQEKLEDGTQTKRRLLLGLIIWAVLGVSVAISVIVGIVSPAVNTALAGACLGAAAMSFTGKAKWRSRAKIARALTAVVGTAAVITDFAVFHSVIGGIVGAVLAAGGIIGVTVAAEQFRPIAPLPKIHRLLLPKEVDVMDDESTGMTILAMPGGAAIAATAVETDAEDPRADRDVLAFVARIDQVRKVMPAGLENLGVKFGGVIVTKAPKPILLKAADGVWCCTQGKLLEALDKVTRGV